MRPPQADHADYSITISACDAISQAVNQAIKPKPRLGISMIGDIGHKIEINRAGQRYAMLGNIRGVFRWIEREDHEIIVSTKTLENQWFL